MFMVAISVIVPVYNVEEYLEESLNSILSQTFKDFEVICVNDESTDNSLKILNSYARKDSRIKVINQKNSGAGGARNNGLKHATGDYVYFFDADDLLTVIALKKLYQFATFNDADVVLFKIARYQEGKKVNYDSPGFDLGSIFPFEDFYRFNFTYKDIKHYVLNASFAPWTKLYKKEFLDKYPDDFVFPTKTAFNDVLFHVKSLLLSSKIAFCPYYLHRYRVSNPKSISNTSSNRKDIFKVCDSVEEFLKRNDFYDEFIDEFYEFKIKQILNHIRSANSEEYYARAKEEFGKLDVNNVNLSKHYINQHNTLLDSSSYEDYKTLVKKSHAFVDIEKHDYSNSPKVSVIVPVYNVEKYLKQCLDSLINQSLEDIEIICVNDCSPDNSMKILQEYADKDERIKIFSTEKNMGLSAARNLGLSHASGEYIDFIDSDDWLDLDTFKETYDFAKSNDLDLLMYQLINYDDEKDEFFETDYYDLKDIDSKYDNEIFNFKDISGVLLDIPVSACNKLIRHDLIKALNLRFEEGYMFEDNPFSQKLFLNSKRMSLIRKHYYNRRISDGSLTTSGSKKFMDTIPIYNFVLKIYEDAGVFDDFKKKLINKKVNLQRMRFNQIQDSYKKEFFEAMKEDLENIKEDTYLFDIYKKDLIDYNLSFFILVLNSDSFDEFLILEKNVLSNKFLCNVSQRTLAKEKEIGALNSMLIKRYRVNLKKNKKIKKYKKMNKNNEKTLNKIYSSNSWKITGIFRSIGRQLRKLKRN